MNKNRVSIGLKGRRRAVGAITLCLVLLVTLLVCCKTTYPPEHRYKYVALIGVDGAGAYFKNTSTPNTDRIFKRSAKSYCALAASPTISGQCWGSILHGVDPEQHGLTNEIAATEKYDVNSPYPSIFRVIRESDPDAMLASFCCWSAINRGIIESNLDVHMKAAYDSYLFNDVLSYLSETQPTMLFVHFESVDAAGHEYGYGGDEFYDALRTVDGYLGQIYDKYDELGILDETLFIVSSDHGGHDKGHGTEQLTDKEIFMGIRGFNVNAINLDGTQGKDIAAIIACALEIDPSPNWTAQVPQNLFDWRYKEQ